MMTRTALALALLVALAAAARGQQPAAFEQKEDRLLIRVNDKPLAEYVWGDEKVRRPYLARVFAPNGVPVTRNHPPVEGKDPTDHATMHPGVWLAFGDLGGSDFWRNKGSVAHVEFVEKPKADKRGGSFSVRNRYAAGDRTVCEEACRITVTVRKDGHLIDWRSEFTGPEEFSFGDQEEMGLGVRVATSLAVRNGGRIVSAEGKENEKGVWGRPSDWCDYSGAAGGARAGVALMAHPDNFRPSWFHARDYGLLVANPFGRKAFTRGDPSMVTVKKGETFRLRFAVFVHDGKADVGAAFAGWAGRKQ